MAPPSTPRYVELSPATSLPVIDIDSAKWGSPPRTVAQDFVTAFNVACTSSSPAVSFFKLFLPVESWWRDIIAFTNDYRTIRNGNIFQAAHDRFPAVHPREAVLRLAPDPVVVQPFEGLDYAFVEVHFDFVTDTGPSFGLARLVPDSVSGQWKIFTLFTLLEGVHGHAEHIGEQRPRGVHNSAAPWQTERDAAAEFGDHDPDVLIVGAGHNGLQLAARLGAVGLQALVIDKQKCIGDNWRLRYESLSLHDPVYSNHFSFMPFPQNWPVFTPAGKLANWFVSYADAMELNVWCESTTVPEETDFDDVTKTWKVTVDRKGVKRFMRTKHVVLAVGLGGGLPKLPPPFLGQNSFSAAGGRMVHSSTHGSGKLWAGKRALVVGACTSAHDIALDLVSNNCEVLMLQRSPTFIMTVKNGARLYHLPFFSENGLPTDVADRKLESIPKHILFLHHQRLTPIIQTQDAELLAGLEKAGFQLTTGPDGTGWQQLALEKAGGYYFDTGASQKIIDGTIKVKGGEIASFNGKTVTFVDGTSGDFDTVIFATGYTGFDDALRRTLGAKFVKMMRPVFGLDSEGETRAVGRDSGIPQMYWSVGHFSLARLLSKVIATQILAEQLGVFGPRYTLDVQRGYA